MSLLNPIQNLIIKSSQSVKALYYMILGKTKAIETKK